MSSLQSLDIAAPLGHHHAAARSARTGHGGGRQADRRRPSASAARPARSPAWNGTTCATRSAHNVGIYDNPHDLTPSTRGR